MTSRVIVKNLPAHATEIRLRELFAAVGEVTDCRLKQTKGGRSRNFGFIGYRTEAEAQTAVTKMDRSFFDTAKMQVQIALPPGSKELGRPWSQHAPGSSAYQRRNPDANKETNKEKTRAGAGGKETEKQGKSGKAKAKPKPLVVPADAKKVEASAVKAGKAGVGTNRVRIEFASSDEETNIIGVEPPREKEDSSQQRKLPSSATNVAFDDEVDDLAYLRAKTRSSNAAADAADPPNTVASIDTTESDGKDAEATADATTGTKKVKKVKVKAKRKKDKAQEQDDAAEVPGDDDPEPAEDPPPSPDGRAEENSEPTERLYIKNLPYGTTEEELQAYFESQGEVSSVYVCKDEDTLKSRGFGYVTYVFPESAVKAQAELDHQPFQGRMLRIEPAKTKPPSVQPDKETAKNYGSSYKRKLEERRKKIDAHMEHTWNLLYVSANAAADAASAQLGVSKSELMGKDAENAALTAALAETSVIQQTKQWLQREGIRVEAFEQAGSSLAKSKAVDLNGTGKRRDDTFIVKHLPAGTDVKELRDRFVRFGEVVRCSLAPSGTVAIVQYTDKGVAKKAFQKLAFSRYRHVPLYLEWAPDDVFSGEQGGQEAQGEAKDGTPNPGQPAGQTGASAKAAADDAEEDAAQGCLFVKNVNFTTTDAMLKSAFSGCRGFRSAVIVKKKASIGAKVPAGKQEPELMSMGYGFVEFDTVANAKEAIKIKQGIQIEDHALQLQMSSRRSTQQAGQERRSVAQTQKGAINTQKLCVRNLAFEVTRKDLHRLFGAYGTVTAVRLPKKSDYSGHRGFAFLDFASKSETASAYEALQHTHLYGRRMVIELAEEAATDVGTVQQAAEKRQAMHQLKSEAKKRKRAGVLNAPGEAADNMSFEAAFTS